MADSSTRCYPTGNGWYVNTPMGPDGPLASRQEAERYMALLNAVSLARDVVACPFAPAGGRGRSVLI